jgi:hypothetical protein
MMSAESWVEWWRGDGREERGSGRVEENQKRTRMKL